MCLTACLPAFLRLLRQGEWPFFCCTPRGSGVSAALLSWDVRVCVCEYLVRKIERGYLPSGKAGY